MVKFGPIRAYWKTVEDCLVELFLFPRAKAREEIASLRQRLDSKGANTRSQHNLIYHAEPLHIAEDLSRTPQLEYEAFFDQYREIRDRYMKPLNTAQEPRRRSIGGVYSTPNATGRQVVTATQPELAAAR